MAPVLSTWAGTDPDHGNPAMRGRRYAIPFEAVWTETIALVDRSPRWTRIHVDDGCGVVRAEARTRLLHFVDDVEIRLSLDMDGQTRVDLTSRSRTGKWDLGTNGRRIRGFLRALDRALDASPDQVLPPEEGRPASRTG